MTSEPLLRASIFCDLSWSMSLTIVTWSSGLRERNARLCPKFISLEGIKRKYNSFLSLLTSNEFLKNRLHFSFSLSAHAFHIYIYVYACFSQGVLLVFHNGEKSLPSFSIKSLPLLHHTNEMTESTPLLKVLFLAPVDFLSPFGLIAFCCTLVILRFHVIRLWV